MKLKVSYFKSSDDINKNEMGHPGFGYWISSVTLQTWREEPEKSTRNLIIVREPPHGTTSAAEIANKIKRVALK